MSDRWLPHGEQLMQSGIPMEHWHITSEMHQKTAQKMAEREPNSKACSLSCAPSTF
ncbi:Uncharacterized protein FKW44_022969 [Caligus rogercresseyi]|uniref:Uncharacterized protein n=1 Tax=Caligus rogercresseyi TaxID=217165 RepID=A0A7T8JTU5_CALRO|nr:Uncharacterized protein FKW44_022969 [Caligus rogercresseyi]